MTKKFITMLVIELDDFHEDLSVLQADFRLRYQKKEISEYVYRENRSTLEEARNGLEQIQNRLMRIKPERYPDLSTLVSEVKEIVIDIFKDCAIPKMDQLFINKKIDKITRYLTEEL
jgi:hypothetical protein